MAKSVRTTSTLPRTDEATEVEGDTAPTDALADVDYSAIKALAFVTYADGDVQRSSSILYITE